MKASVRRGERRLQWRRGRGRSRLARPKRKGIPAGWRTFDRPPQPAIDTATRWSSHFAAKRKSRRSEFDCSQQHADDVWANVDLPPQCWPRAAKILFLEKFS